MTGAEIIAFARKRGVAAVSSSASFAFTPRASGTSVNRNRRHQEMTRPDCQKEDGWVQTTQLSKERVGLLRTVLDGTARHITVQSFYGHLLELASAPRKVREPAERHPRTPRARTPPELAGLRKGNEARRLEALARRVKKASQVEEPAKPPKSRAVEKRAAPHG